MFNKFKYNKKLCVCIYIGTVVTITTKHKLLDLYVCFSRFKSYTTDFRGRSVHKTRGEWGTFMVNIDLCRGIFLYLTI